MAQEYLDEWQRDVVGFVERVHSITGGLPEDSDIKSYLRLLRHDATEEDIEDLKTNPLFHASMEARGIPVREEFISARQLAAVSAMLNLVDRRSDEKKLRDIGVSTEEWSTWMLNKTFANYVAQRSENLIENSVHEAHLGLMRSVRQGNTAAIQLYYKLTGRYDPDNESNVNVRLVIGRVLEAIQKHIKDPAKLNALAVEMSQIAIESSSPVAKSSIPGQSTRKELM